MIRLNVFIQVNESNRNAALETAKELVAQSTFVFITIEQPKLIRNIRV